MGSSCEKALGVSVSQLRGEGAPDHADTEGAGKPSACGPAPLRTRSAYALCCLTPGRPDNKQARLWIKKQPI